MVNTERLIIADKVKSILAEKMGLRIDEIEDKAHLYDDIGLDSLDALEVELDLEKYYRIEIPDEQLELWRKVEDIVSYLDDVLNPVGI